MRQTVKHLSFTGICLLVLLVNVRWNKQLPKSRYLGEKPPSITPKVFAPGLVSDGLGNRDMAISPNGDELFYTIQQPRGTVSAIMHCRQTGGKWSAPEVAEFSGYYNDLEPAFSPDGLTLYFSSNRPLADTGHVKDYDIWSVKKVGGRWMHVTNAGPVVNSKKDEFYAAPTKSGNLYFTRDMGNTKEDIVVARYINGKYENPVSLSDSVNSSGYEFNAYVDVDESLIVFTAYRRPDDIGGGDLYISFRKEGGWTTARNLGAAINSPALDYCPFLTPDKKFLFSTSSRPAISSPMSHRVDFKQLRSLLTSYGNGSDDIYWVSTKELLKN